MPGRRQRPGALGWDDALRRLEEERVVEQPPEAAKTVADGGGGEVQPLGRATDIPLLQHHFVEHQEIEIGT